MQQISEAQNRLDQRMDSQRIRYKCKKPSFQSHHRVKINPEHTRRDHVQPGKLYLRSVDTDKLKQYYNDYPKQKDYYSVDSEMQQNEGNRFSLKGFERLPNINRNKAHSNLSQSNKERAPTISSLLQGQSSLRRDKEYKRAYSGNSIPLGQSTKRRPKKMENYSESKIQQKAVQNYLANEYKARYPSTQVKNYLARMKMREFQSQQKDKAEDRQYYQTFFGKQPQFYKLQTEYALQLSAPKKIESSRFTNHKTVQLPVIPSRQRIAQFIQNYVSFSKQINVERIMKQTNFLVQYSPTEMYFGEMITRVNHTGNIRDGLGVLLTKTSCFQGLFQSHEKVKGCEVNSCGVYRGQYKNNKKQGTGEFQWTNGEYYIGDWRDSQRHGNGIWTNKRGESYNGEWHKGRTEGTGIYISQGREYHGDFTDFKKDGWGKQKFSNQDIYQGVFKDGMPHGKGVYVWSNGTRYEGEFANGIRNGKGLLTNLDGFSYNGQFIDQRPQGLCEIYMPNGDIYQGYLREGKKYGRGVLFLKQSGRALDGLWQSDMFISEIK